MLLPPPSSSPFPPSFSSCAAAFSNSHSSTTTSFPPFSPSSFSRSFQYLLCSDLSSEIAENFVASKQIGGAVSKVSLSSSGRVMAGQQISPQTTCGGTRCYNRHNFKYIQCKINLKEKPYLLLFAQVRIPPRVLSLRQHISTELNTSCTFQGRRASPCSV